MFIDNNNDNDMTFFGNIVYKIRRMMKQEPISCRADNALAARCQSFAAR